MPRCRNRTKYSLGKDFLVVQKSVRIAIARVLSEVCGNALIRLQLERNTDRVSEISSAVSSALLPTQ